LPDGREVFEVLGDDSSDQGTIYISDLLGRLFDQVRAVVDFECQVEVTVSGSLSLKGKGDAKLLLFNVGGEATKETSMSIKLTAQLSPVG
jgi:hypothetical protein